MPDRFFRLNLVQSDDPEVPGQVPEHVDAMGLSFSGFTIGASPIFVVRVYGSTSELDDLASRSGVNEITDQRAADLFNSQSDNQIAGVSKPISIEELKQAHQIQVV